MSAARRRLARLALPAARARGGPAPRPPAFALSSSTSTAAAPPPAAAPAAADSGSGGGWLQRLRHMAGWYGEESTSIRHSHALFKSCFAQATRRGLKEHLALEDDFFHNHALINLHVWMVHNRLRTVGGLGKPLQEQLFDRCWEDTTKRIRALSVPELTVNKHLRETQTFSFGAAVAYDHGLKEGTDALAGSLYRNVFCNNQDVAESTVLEMAAYVEEQVGSLGQVAHEDVCEGRLVWIAPPGCAGGPGQQVSGPVSVEASWVEAVDANGRTYWFHEQTKETTWTNPWTTAR